ncbi:MAG: hypothetical protein M0R80_24815 [Proteobacteria bacterium]|jgi:hypothetical protein|nr:hypothetical protein [Pseudomonadota bacterium]
MDRPKNTNVKMLFELRSLSAATTRLALLDYFFGQTELADKVRQRGFTTGNLGDYLNQARREIGLPELAGPGPAQTYLRSHVVDEDAADGIDRIFVADAERKSKRGTRHFKSQVKTWMEAWRFLFAPSHREVRDNANHGQLSTHPAQITSEGVIAYRFVPSSVTLPMLDVHHVRDVNAIRKHLDAYGGYRFPKGPEKSKAGGHDASDMTEGYFTRVAFPQIYMLIFAPGGTDPASSVLQTYVGQTTEPNIRLPQHQAGYRREKKLIHDAFIAFPAPHEGDLSAVEKGIAESMCINFFKEISNNGNRVEGGDSLPADMTPVRRAAAFSTAFCAAVLRIVREQKTGFPFHEEMTGLLKRKDGAQTVVERYLNGGEVSPA